MTDTTDREAVNKAIGMCRSHGLHGTEATLRALLAHVEAAEAERDAAISSKDEWKRGWYALDQDTRADLSAARKRAETAEAERDNLAKAIKRVQRIRRDIEDFDGDKRGHYAALGDAEQDAVQLANTALRALADKGESQ